LSGDAGNFDVDGFLLHARKHLPKYAVPVFVRLVAARSSTDNNKQNKVPLRDEGIDVSKFGSKVVGGQNDALLWLAPGGSGYVAFDKGCLDALRSGEVVL
jgi:hypothetical protein